MMRRHAYADIGKSLLFVLGLVSIYIMRIRLVGLVDQVGVRLLAPGYYISGMIAQSFRQGQLMVSQYQHYHTRYELLARQYRELLADYAHVWDELHRLRAWWGPSRFEAMSLTYHCTARIMIIHQQGDQRWMMIDRGRMHGVEPESLVMVQGILAGIVIQVFDHCSRVAGVGDRSNGIPVAAWDHSYTGVLVGCADSQELCDIMYVPHTAHPREGDLIVCSGQGNRYPAGLCVARIISCCLDPSQVMYTIRAQSLINLGLSDIAVVVRPLQGDSAWPAARVL